MTPLFKHHPKKIIFVTLLIILILFHHWFLSLLGNFLVHDQEFVEADVAVVLNTGADINMNFNLIVNL